MKANRDDRDLPSTVGWADIYQQEATRLMRLATVLVGPSNAHDLVADTVARAVTSPKWSSVREPSAFLTTSLVNAAMNQHRSTSRRDRRERRWAQPEPAHPFDPTDSNDVRRSLSVLSPQQRAVVFFVYWEDLTVADTAHRLGVSEGTIRQQLHRAKSQLREILR